MMIFIRDRRLAVILTLISLLILMELVFRILYGYTSGSFFAVIPMDFLLPGITYILILICVIVTVHAIIRKQQKIHFTISWIILCLFIIALGYTPIEYFEIFGGLLSIYHTNPTKVLSDARMLANEYPPMTCIGFPERYPCNDPIPADHLPGSIQSMYRGEVLVEDNYVLIEKFGLEGVFRGFIVFRKGADIWANEKPITQIGCSTCWKIRIIDGLYWYSATPSDPPIYESPLK